MTDKNQIWLATLNFKQWLIALFRYKIQTVYIRFVGTHKEYDKIENIENI